MTSDMTVMHFFCVKLGFFPTDKNHPDFHSASGKQDGTLYYDHPKSLPYLSWNLKQKSILLPVDISKIMLDEWQTV